MVRVLGDDTRRAIFEALRDGPRPVGELVELVPISQPAVSQHLKVLREAELVTVTPVGTRRIYRIEPAGVAALRTYFESFWRDSLTSFKDAAERGWKDQQS